MPSLDAALLQRIWADLDGPADAISGVTFSGPERLLPSVYEVSALAAASIAAATAAVAEFCALRTDGRKRAVFVDRSHASVAFRSERYVSATGWRLPPVWDPIAGDYRARDVWIRLHTNYRYHRDAVARVLGAAESRDEVAQAVATWAADDLETAVVAAGGCAARMRNAAEWAAHPQGEAVAREPLFETETWPAASPSVPQGAPRQAADLPERASGPLAGTRVLDLTRVIAGPVGTRLLAAYGADVLRIDPPGFEEVGALLCETTAGKRCAFLDLRDGSGRATFERLLAGAHVIVHGYRADALERLGFGSARRRAINPSLIDVRLDAYGWTGPWANRRGFDSLVQMSTGIAARGQQATGADKPFPLPAQALDHAAGYLIAAAVCRALVRRVAEGRASDVRTSLARVAKLLTDLGDSGDPRAADLSIEEAARWREPAKTAYGAIARVRCPGKIEGVEARWEIGAGPLGVAAPQW
jgi:crotonobetainyl-CoA:carnitine CoA-transferase CaiB-like acyl-CoA transferase